MAVRSKRRMHHQGRSRPIVHFSRKVAFGIPKNGRPKPKAFQVDGAKVPLPGLAGRSAKPASDQPVPTAHRERSSYDGDTAIKLYLREIGQVKLLTPEE